MSEQNNRPTFEPISSPRYTLVPDYFFDQVMEHLKGAELKIYLFICRKTFGWKEDTANLSLNYIAAKLNLEDH